MIIEAQYHSTCTTCGAHVKPKDRVNWLRGNGVVVCQACKMATHRSATIKVYGVDMHVAIQGRKDGPSTQAVVTPVTAEVWGNINLNLDGTVRTIGASTALMRGDLCDYIQHAQEALRILMASTEENLSTVPGN